MSNRTLSATSDSFSVFPLVAVLLCTMGALLVLLVVFAQRTAESIPLVVANPIPIVEAPPKKESEAESTKLKDELVEVTEYRKKLEEFRAEGKKHLEEEQLKLAHSEEHMRRLQEELAKLSIEAETLKETEKNQSVDREQAAAEADRLEKLIKDTTEQIELLRASEPAGKKSYAIVPYKGANGTYRKPIYIECSKEGVILQPEGLRLTAQDFIAPNWPGNPLASALRASRDYLNDKAAKAGEPVPPDPYPLIIIRPSGIQQYTLTRAAITSWDSDYGYEFVDEEMKLAFPDTIDPQLARIQQHAVMNARERLLHLVQSAPSRFRGIKVGGSSAASGGGPSTTASGGGQGEFGAPGTGWDGESNSSDGTGTGGNGYAAGKSQGLPAGQTGMSETDETQFGGMAGGGGGSIAAKDAGQPGAGEGKADSRMPEGSQPSLVGDRYAQAGSTTAQGTAGQGTPNNAPSEPIDGKDKAGQGAGNRQTASSNSGGSASNQASVSFGSSSGSSSSSTEPISASQGSNWAVEQPGQKSVAIRRPISVVVRENKMIFLPTGGAKRGLESAAQEISLDQSVREISQSFSRIVKDRIDEWGLAGYNMYWRPVLHLEVEPNATMTANRIAHLLQDSGVEVQFPTTADSRGQTSGGAVR